MPWADDLALTRGLERCEVPAGGFPHASHLRVAWVYLRESPSLDEAIARMAGTLRAFAASAGQPGKYSYPTTVFWMLQIASVRALMPDAEIDDVLRAFPHLLDRDFITSVLATREPRTPDLAPDR